MKSTLFDRRVRINLAVFSSDYKDIQRGVVINAAQILANAAKATIRGVEVETTFVPFDGLELTGNLGYTDARFNEYLNFDVNGGGYDPAVDPVLARALKLERVPAWTAFVGAAYRFHIPGFAPEISLNTSYSYRSTIYSDALNTIRNPPLGLLDANIGIDNGTLRVSFYGRNLTNKADIQLGNRIGFGPGVRGSSVVNYYGSPRQYGVEVGFRF